MSPLRRLIFLFAIGLALSACGGDSLTLTPLGTEGRTVANARGCDSCHGKNGQGITAPSWRGIHGTERRLETGEFVVADDDYLRLAITDPGAQRVEGYKIKMPQNDLSDDEIDLVIAYIRDLKVQP